MELNKTKKWFYALTTIASIFILSLGGWWLYLVFTLAHKLEKLRIPEVTGNLLYMVQWEGLSFIFVMLVLTFAMFYIFIQDRKKTQAISSFFASMTHELKTPLASIRLQGQVIAELAENLELGNNQLLKYVERLKQDTIRLENELDKSLQLSRLEKGGILNLHPVELKSFIGKLISSYDQIHFNITGSEDLEVMVDDMALRMILRNLIENTIKHNKSVSKLVDIKLIESSNKVTLEYNDHGKVFTGEIKRLGNLFYKHESPSGSGIGLYLIRKLSKKMGGNFKINNHQNLSFEIELLKKI